MNKKFKIAVAVLLIIVISLSSGLILDFGIKKVEELFYPRKYTELVEKYSELYDVPESVVYATINTESKFRPDAVSSVGAIGLMQIMPETFEWLQGLMGERLDERTLYDPETNIKYGVFYLSWLYDHFGLWETVYAAYNAGIGNVKEWLKNPEYTNENGQLTEIPFPETRKYVKKVTRAYKKYENLY